MSEDQDSHRDRFLGKKGSAKFFNLFVVSLTKIQRTTINLQKLATSNKLYDFLLFRFNLRSLSCVFLSSTLAYDYLFCVFSLVSFPTSDMVDCKCVLSMDNCEGVA